MGENKVNSEQSYAEIALTLTTGRVPSALCIRKANQQLNDILVKYKDRFEEFIIFIEILDKNYVETKVHYHGYVKIDYINLSSYNQFLREYNEIIKGHVKSVKITDKEKWLKYIEKQQHILKSGYSHIIDKFMFTKDNLSSKTLRFHRLKQNKQIVYTSNIDDYINNL